MMKKCCPISMVPQVIEFLMERFRRWNILDLTIFKVCMLSFGLWIGSLFSEFFKKYRIFVLLAFIASWVYLAYRIFKNEE